MYIELVGSKHAGEDDLELPPIVLDARAAVAQFWWVQARSIRRAGKEPQCLARLIVIDDVLLVPNGDLCFEKRVIQSLQVRSFRLVGYSFCRVDPVVY